MAQEMEDQRSSHRAQLAAKDDEIKRLLDELTNQVRSQFIWWKFGVYTESL